MTTEEKLKYFMEAAMSTADAESSKLLEDYKAGLDHIFEEQKAELIKKAELQKSIEADGIRRDTHKAFVTEQLEVKRKISLKQEELKVKLFDEVLDGLKEFKKGDKYRKFLIKKIKEAKKVARFEEMIIYIDPSDRALAEELEEETKAKITISEYSFLGGMRAVIPSKNILVEHSLEVKLANAREQFTITF